MNQDVIKIINEYTTKMTYEKALEIINTKYIKSKKILKATDKLIDAYNDTRDLNTQEIEEVFKLFFAYIYLNNKKNNTK